jgi:hypothetical protein
MRSLAALLVCFVTTYALAQLSPTPRDTGTHREAARTASLYLSFFEPRAVGRPLTVPEIPRLQEQADQGDSGAQFLMGSAYENGWGVEASPEQAAVWYRKAAEHGLAAAQINLGYAYHHGAGVQQDYKEAARWYRAAAERGDAFAENDLGYLYESGHRTHPVLQSATETPA